MWQVGLTYEVCFAGRNSNENPLGSFVDILRCILIQARSVTQPDGGGTLPDGGLSECTTPCKVTPGYNPV